MSELSMDSPEAVKRSSDGLADAGLDAIPGGDAVDSPGTVMLILDAGGTVEAFNRKAAGLTGLSRDAVIGKEVFPLLFPENLRDLARTVLLEDLRRYGELTNILLPVLAGNGRKLPVRWDFFAQRDLRGEFAGIVGIGQLGSEAAAIPLPCANTRQLVHDILNHNQVAMGYLELAMEQVKPGHDLQPVLNHVYTALRHSSDLTLDVYQASRNSQDQCGYLLQAGLTARK